MRSHWTARMRTRPTLLQQLTCLSREMLRPPLQMARSGGAPGRSASARG